MTTYEKTWQFDPNRVPGLQTTIALQTANFLWQVKAFLKGDIGGATVGLWTCEGSSSSVANGMAGVDLWSGAASQLTSFDATTATKVVSAAGAHSWIVLKSPVGMGPWYLIIDYNSSNNYLWSVIFSKTLPTGGSNSARPTAADEVVLLSSSQFSQTSLATGVKFHGLLATDGSFLILMSNDGTGKFTCGIGCSVLADTRAGDNNGVIFFFDYSASTLFSYSTMYAATNTHTRGRNKDNTASLNLSMLIPVYNSSTNIMSDIGTADNTDGKFPDWPIYVYADNVGQKSIKGRIPDIYWATGNLPHGFAEAQGGLTSIVVGNFWIPATTAPLL